MYQKIAFYACVTLLLVPHVSMAAVPIVSDPVRPYEPLPVDPTITREQIYLGELAGDPHMYEVTIGEEIDFSLVLVQADTASLIPFSLILVREAEQNRGVVEIGRLKGNEVTWEPYWDALLVMSLQRAERYATRLTPGVYRFEISTPDNTGRYMLILGTESNGDGYLTKFKTIRSVQEFFGYSGFRMLISTHVLYPLGSLVILILIYRTWQSRRLRGNIPGQNHHG